MLRRSAAVDHLRLEDPGDAGVRADPDPQVVDAGADREALHA